jgi:hypothetical protein
MNSLDAAAGFCGIALLSCFAGLAEQELKSPAGSGCLSQELSPWDNYIPEHRHPVKTFPRVSGGAAWHAGQRGALPVVALGSAAGGERVTGFEWG